MTSIGHLTMPPIPKTADTLEVGDVFDASRSGWDWGWVVCIEESDTGSSFSPDEVFTFNRKKVLGKDCCEPRVCLLGKTGRMTHEVSYMVLPNRMKIDVVAFLDVEISSAVPEPHPLVPRTPTPTHP